MGKRGIFICCPVNELAVFGNDGGPATDEGGSPMRWTMVVGVAALLLMVLVAGCEGIGDSSDPVVTSFAYMADGQIGYPAWLATKAQNPSSANLPQLKQNLLDMAHLNQPLAFTMFGGDCVLGEADDNGQTLQEELDAWQTAKASYTGAASIKLMLLDGNHESNAVANNAAFPNPPAFDVWTKWLSAHGYDSRAGNGPTPASSPADMLGRDERKLTYSFNERSTHIIVINTDTLSTVDDPSSGKPYCGWIAINWIEQDIKVAQANRAINTIFVLGHRPIEDPPFKNSDTSGIINTVEHPFATRLATVLRQNSKVRAYVCSHVHAFSAFRLNGGKGAWQFIIGNGGAPVEVNWLPVSEQDYGFAVFNVHQSGKVTVVRYGRPLPPAPQLFYEDSPVPPSPAVVKSQIVIK